MTGRDNKTKRRLLWDIQLSRMKTAISTNALNSPELEFTWLQELLGPQLQQPFVEFLGNQIELGVPRVPESFHNGANCQKLFLCDYRKCWLM